MARDEHRKPEAEATRIPDGLLEDRNGDGIIDYLNGRIYLAADATGREVAAAANIAARLAFETTSLDLPIGGRIAEFSPSDQSVAIVVGRAANRWTRQRRGVVEVSEGSRRVIAIPHADDALRWALSPSPAGDADREVRPADPSTRPHSLSDLFTPAGVSGPIRVILSVAADFKAVELIDLAARIALETTCLSLPLALVGADEDPAAHRILVGRSHPEVRALEQSGALSVDLSAGEGYIGLLSHPEARRLTLVITGRDPQGESAALDYAASRFPFASEYGKGNLTLSHIEEDLHRFITRRSGSGQLAAGLVAARRRRADTGPGRQDSRTTIDVIGIEGAGTLPDGTRLTVRNVGFDACQTIFDETFTLDWEVDRARSLIENHLVPAMRSGSALDLEVRLSEPPGVRTALTDELTSHLVQRGADPRRSRVRVLSAYKQGYSWIDEALRNRFHRATSVTIHVREACRDSPISIDSARRWLEELYPIDEVLAKRHGWHPDDVSLEMVPNGPTYRVVARDSDGQVCLNETFEPKVIERPLFASFEDYATSLVSTGWVRATLDGHVVLDARVPTDPETFWDEFQRRGLERLASYLLGLYDGRPDPDLAPHFGTFEIEVAMSEPDERIGIDEERISTPEALHEDLYFQTLLFIDLVGQQYSRAKLPYPGRIVPKVRPRSGAGPRVRLRLTGKTAPGPAVALEDTDESGRQRTWNQTLKPLKRPTIGISGLTVRSNSPDLVLEVSEAAPRMITEETLGALEDLRPMGLLSGILCYPGIGRIDFLCGEADDRTKISYLPERRAGDEGPRRLEPCAPRGPKIVPSDVALSPDEAARCMAELASFRPVRTFYAGRSFLAAPIWALEVTAPLEGRYVSQAKSNATKPTLFITGRQHGNEVSATSHILQLVEELARPSGGHRRLLDRINLVALPVTNPDGAELASQLAETTPDFMLHAGYYGCLGEDVTHDQWNENSVYPETPIRRQLWEMYQPDVVLDAHGYPSHEWVQIFGGYTAWFRSREVVRREWWIPRGAFLPAFDAVEKPEFPYHRELAFALRDTLTRALSRSLGHISATMYRRHEKYLAGGTPAPHTEIHNGILVCRASPGSNGPRVQTFMKRHPEITAFETVLELPDETARGPWLESLCSTGLEASLACMRLLARSSYEVRRTRRVEADRVVFQIVRPRPVRPPETDS